MEGRGFGGSRSRVGMKASQTKKRWEALKGDSSAWVNVQIIFHIDRGSTIEGLRRGKWVEGGVSKSQSYKNKSIKKNFMVLGRQGGL